jgi:hypothetical protein
MSNSFNYNDFNSLLEKATDAVLCNSDCQRQRTAERLNRAYLNAQTNLASASNQQQVAQRNYVVFTQGNSGYNNLLDAQLTREANEIATAFTNIFNAESRNVERQINSYQGLTTNLQNVVDLSEKYKTENKELFNELKEETNDVLTNERKTYYENQNVEGLSFYYYYFLLTIYYICVICFGFFTLVYPSQTNWKIRLAIFIGFIFLPFFSTLFLSIIVYLSYKIYNLLPKNVYK